MSQGAGRHSQNTTLTLLVQGPTGAHSNKVSQPDSVPPLTGQASTDEIVETKVDETAREGSVVKENAADTLIARSDYENTLNKILD